MNVSVYVAPVFILSEKFFLSVAGSFCVVGLSRCVLWGMGGCFAG